MADDEARIVSFLGRCRRTDRWRSAEDTRVVAVLGTCLLDLRHAEADADRLGFDVLSVLGSVEIIVPAGSDVAPSGAAFLAGVRCEVPVGDLAGPLPPIEVDSLTVLGRLRVHVGQLPPRRSLLDRLLRRHPPVASPGRERAEVAGSAGVGPTDPAPTPVEPEPVPPAPVAPVDGETVLSPEPDVEAVASDGSDQRAEVPVSA